MNKHHFFHSWQNADGSNDKKLKSTLLINELANIIVIRPEIAISNLIKSGVDIKDDATAAQITAAYEENLPKNKELAKLTALEIMAGNKTSFDGKQYGKKYFGAEGVDYGELANSIGTLVSSIVQSSQAKKDAKKAEKANKEAIKAEEIKSRLQMAVATKQAQMMAKIQQMGAGVQDTGKSTWLWVGGILLAVTAISVGLYYAFGNKSGAAPATPAPLMPTPVV